MKKILNLLPLFLFSYICLQADLTGHYKVNGFDPFVGKQYTGTATLEKQGDTYKILWVIDNGTTNIGTGVRKDDQLSFIFRGVEDPAFLGVQVYEIKDHDHLKGPWTLLGATIEGVESLKKVRCSDSSEN